MKRPRLPQLKEQPESMDTKWGLLGLESMMAPSGSCSISMLTCHVRAVRGAREPGPDFCFSASGGICTGLPRPPLVFCAPTESGRWHSRQLQMAGEGAHLFLHLCSNHTETSCVVSSNLGNWTWGSVCTARSIGRSSPTQATTSEHSLLTIVPHVLSHNF